MTGDRWFPDLPAHWTAEHMKHVLRCVDKKVNAQESALPYIGLENIESWTARRIFSESSVEANGTANEYGSGDVLFGKLRPYLAKVFEAEAPGVCSTEFLVLRPEKVTSRYLRYAVLCESFIDAVNAWTYGVKMPRAGWDIIGNLLVPTPPKSDQDAITAFLDHETSKADTLVAKYEQLIALLEEKRVALITRAVTKGLDPNVRMKDSGVGWIGEIPAHWSVTPLRYLVQCLDGKRVPLNAEQRSFMQGDYPYWGANGVVDHLNDYLFDEELVLLGEDGAPFFEPLKNVAFVVKGKVWINNHIHVLRPNPLRVIAAFLVHSLNCVNWCQFIEGSTRDKLTQEAMKSIPVALPPMSEQSKICDIIGKELEPIQRLISNCGRAIELVNEHRTAVTTAAVTGQIDVRTYKARDLEEVVA